MGRCRKTKIFPCENFIAVENFPGEKKVSSYVTFVTTKKDHFMLNLGIIGLNLVILAENMLL